MADGPDNFEHLRAWIGRQESREDVLTPAPTAGLAATLDHAEPPVEGDELPPLWHWLYFLPAARQSEVGVDGHPARGGFLPPVLLPRRMWAGGRLVFHHPLIVGEEVRRDSIIADLQHKRGRSGDLLFVLVRHEIYGTRGRAITEEQQIVYRAPTGSAREAGAVSEPRKADWQRAIHPEPVLLFRYSALTFNGHRIHYDRPYAINVEAYPGLVVHGPLIATLLLDLLCDAHPKRTVAQFEFRAQRPLFDTADFVVAGALTDQRTCSLWATDASGAVAMDATAVLAE